MGETNLSWSHSGPFVYFRALSVKTTRVALLLTCYDVFDVIEWFSRENTQKCAFTAAASYRAVLELLRTRFCYFYALSVRTTRDALLFTCYDVVDVIVWFLLESTKTCEFSCRWVKLSCFLAIWDLFR